MSMVKQGLSVLEIVNLTKVKNATIDEIVKNYNRGLKEENKKIMFDVGSDTDKFKNSDWAYVYGVHQRIHKQFNKK